MTDKKFSIIKEGPNPTCPETPDMPLIGYVITSLEMAINTSYMLANMLNSLGILEDPYEMEGSGDLLIDKVKNLHKVTEANRNDANRLKIALMGE